MVNYFRDVSGVEFDPTNLLIYHHHQYYQHTIIIYTSYDYTINQLALLDIAQNELVIYFRLEGWLEEPLLPSNQLRQYAYRLHVLLDNNQCCCCSWFKLFFFLSSALTLSSTPCPCSPTVPWIPGFENWIRYWL